MGRYKTDEVAHLFGVKPYSVTRWADDFCDQLGPEACPGYRKTRYFSDLDIEKLDFISKMRLKHADDDDIRVALINGQKGEAPDDVTALAMLESSNQPKYLQIRIDKLKIEIEKIKIENVSLKADKILLQQQLEAKEKEARDLLKKLWQHGIE